MNRAYFRASGWVLVFAAGASAQPAQPAQFQLNSVPDFSQYHNAAWRNYCAPTSGADWVYHFANTYPALRQGNPVGPGGAADNGVDAIIAGNPPPAVGSLAQLMGTTLNGGTTLLGCANGLDAYLEANDGLAGNANWNTSMVLLANYPGPSAINFFTALQQTLAAGGGVILAIGWNNGNPGGYDIPDGYVPGDSAGSAVGHAVAMTGYNTVVINPAPPTVSINDPANNWGVVMPPPPHN